MSLALREAVTNVVRHAHARRCTVTLRRHDADHRGAHVATADGTVTVIAVPSRTARVMFPPRATMRSRMPVKPLRAVQALV